MSHAAPVLTHVMIWNIISTIATMISTVAFVLSAIYIRAELKSLEKDRYLTITTDLFTIWQSQDFMAAQLWLQHQLEALTWAEFLAQHRNGYGEIAFYRVGSFYNRVGTLANMNLVNEQDILPTIGAEAVAIWHKIEPMVREARLSENAVLFQDYERLLPACYECYVPGLGSGAGQPTAVPAQAALISIGDLRKKLKHADPVTVLDVRRAEQVAGSPATLPKAIHIPLDQLENNLSLLPPGPEVVVYCA